MLEKILHIADHMKLLDIHTKSSNSKVAILTYHRVTNKQNDWSLNPLPVKSFENHLKFITKTYNIISLDNLVNLIDSRKKIPNKTVVLTFDDGYKDNYINAFPLLKKYEIPATIFLTSKLIGSGELAWNDKVGYIIYNTSINQIKMDGLGEYRLDSNFEKYKTFSDIKRKLIKFDEVKKHSFIDELANVCNVEISPHIGEELMLSWNEVKEMNENGIDFGAHTMNHPILPNLTLEEVRYEIFESKKMIEENLQKQVKFFSYPYGDFNQDTINIIKELGFKCAVTLDQRLINPEKYDLCTLSRIDGFEDLSFLKLFLLDYGKYFYNLVKLKNRIITNNASFFKIIMNRK